MRSGVDVVLRPRDIAVAMAGGLFHGVQLGLVQVGNVSLAVFGPEGQTVADVAAAVLKVEQAHGNLRAHASLRYLGEWQIGVGWSIGIARHRAGLRSAGWMRRLQD